ncbi:MAG TPA: cupin domain-containing protein, partial [Synergistales bacterium]|nr:cupin domain-containing protein [Synergistales bacterium]
MKTEKEPRVWTREELLERASSGEDGRNEDKGIYISFLEHFQHGSINVVELKKGIPGHCHLDHDEIIQVLEGEGKASINGEEKQLKTGDLLFCPRGSFHSIHFPVKLLSIYLPSFDPRKPDRVFQE